MKEINVKVNPNLEFINSILLTSKYNQLTKPYVGYGLMTEKINHYTSEIKRFFEKYKTSSIYGEIEEMIPNGFTFSRPVELMLSLGDSQNFSVQYPLSELCAQYCGGLEKISVLLRHLYRFSKETNYSGFFDTIKSYYQPYLKAVHDFVGSYPFVSMLESTFGKRQNSYHYVISELMIGNFGISFLDKKNMSADIFSVFCSDKVSNDCETNEFNGGALSANVVFHEFSHSFINPLTDQYYDIAAQYSKSYESLKKYKLPDYRSGYGDWKECINEHFVRAMAIHLLSKCHRIEWSNQYLANDLYRGYKYIPAILELYQYYDHNRAKYKTFEKFYPVLLNVFANTI